MSISLMQTCFAMKKVSYKNKNKKKKKKLYLQFLKHTQNKSHFMAIQYLSAK